MYQRRGPRRAVGRGCGICLRMVGAEELKGSIEMYRFRPLDRMLAGLIGRGTQIAAGAALGVLVGGRGWPRTRWVRR